MMEPISASAMAHAAKEMAVREIPKEATETGLKESVLSEQLDIIKNNSLESLKAQDEAFSQRLKEYKTQVEINYEMGDFREKNVFSELKENYPEKDGYKIFPERYLCDKEGKIVRDTVSREARRIDFLIGTDREIMKSIEVTSEKAPKEMQLAKEERIREQGGNYIRSPETGELIIFPSNIKTEIWRRA